jgi:hypothetical protein
VFLLSFTGKTLIFRNSFKNGFWDFYHGTSNVGAGGFTQSAFSLGKF